MPLPKFLFLLGLVIATAGLSVWVVAAAIATDRFDNTTWRAVLPLLLIASVAVRALTRGRKDRESGK